MERCSICKQCQNEAVSVSHTVCKLCGIPLVSERENCLRCRDRKYSFTCNKSLFEYKSMAKDIFYQYKFEGYREIAIWYARLMSEIIEDRYAGYVIVPSPPNAGKKVIKGWDQVETLCLYLKKQKRYEVRSVLHKKRGREQKELDHEGRSENMAGRIVPKKGVSCIRGRRILLVDDIFTTGATAHECASVLKRNGAREVVSLTIAID